jgi:hypothetical protein
VGVVEVVVGRVRGVVVWVGVEVEEVEVKGSALAAMGAGVGVAVEEMGWAGHSWGLQEGAACTAQQILAISEHVLRFCQHPWMRHTNHQQVLHTTWRPPCSHPLQIAASRMWEVTARCPGKLRALTILRPRPGGPFYQVLTALSNTATVVGQLGSGKIEPAEAFH